LITTEDEMPTDEVRAALGAYVDALVARADFSRFFTDDVRASIVGTPQRATGADAVEQMIRFMHEVAFDARPEPKNMLVDDGKAALEADFVGVHIGEFAGIAATQNSVRVPYSVIYDLDGDRDQGSPDLHALEDLLAQLGAPVASAQAGAQA
jgi:predicted ester cyclase